MSQTLHVLHTPQARKHLNVISPSKTHTPLDCSEFDMLKQEQDKMRESQDQDIENMDGSRSPEGESALRNCTSYCY